MKSILSCLALSLLAAGAAHAQLAPCPEMTVIAPPAVPEGGALHLTNAPANSASCDMGISFEPDPGVRVWRCNVDYGATAEPADPWLNAVLVMPPGQPAQTYRDDVMVGSLEQMRVVKADLDGDGSDERILALWNATSNGMAVSSWTLHVFTTDWAPIATFDDVKEWGQSSIVAAPAGRKGCDLAITAWVDSLNAKGRQGLSLEARFLRLSAGAMIPASDRPTLRRRYTYAFENERGLSMEKTGWIEGDIAGWLSHPSVTPAR